MQAIQPLVPEFAIHILTKAVDSLSAGYFQLDTNCAVRTFTPSLEEYYPGLSTSVAPGQSYQELMRVLSRYGELSYRQRDCDVNINSIPMLSESAPAESLLCEQNVSRARSLCIKPVFLEQLGWLLILTDTTAQRSESEALQQSEEKFHRFAKLASQWFWELDENLCYRYHSTHQQAMAVSNATDLVGRSRIESLLGKAVADDQFDMHNHALLNHEPIDVVLSWKHSGTIQLSYTHVQAEPQFDVTGKFRGYIGCGRDVSAASKLRNQLQHYATHDQLTGLLNRKAFELSVSNVIERFSTSEADNVEKYSLICLNLFSFKLINESFGHAAGDKLLVHTSTLLSQCLIGEEHRMSRLGGDEFAICVRRDAEHAMLLANSIMQSIKDVSFLWDSRSLTIATSIGVAPLDNSVCSASVMIKNASVACESAKTLGRNRIELFSDQNLLHKCQSTELATLRQICAALESDRVELYLQPIVPTNAMLKEEKYEALVRITSEDGQLVPPLDFIATAEKYDVVASIDLRVVEKALSCITTLKEEGIDITLSINLSGKTLSSREHLDDIASRVEALSISKGQLCFEITETAAIHNLQIVNEFMVRLRQSNCEFSLDDFGSGLSSYGYLESLHVDYIKIDGMFVQKMQADTASLAIVKSVHTLAHEMGMRTVAEYVETQQQADILGEIGIDFLQGYYFGRPVRSDDVLGELRAVDCGLS